ncbi:MAG: corrinoid protein [Pseudomonadota bacterium]|nr:corrinoid protein [Pseudomonadota bacterium]
MDTNELLEKIALNVVQGRVEAEDEGFDQGMEGQPGVTELVTEALKQDIDPKRILMESLTNSMQKVGEKFEKNEYLIPDMLASAECVGVAMDMLSPYLVKAGVKSKGKFVIATVKDDLHDIGKNIVAIMLKGAGYDVVDLKTDVSTERIIKAVKENNASYLGLSALLTTTMRNMEDVIKELKKEGLRDKVKVLIGGAPISQEFADQIGADGYGKDAFQTLEIMKKYEQEKAA